MIPEHVSITLKLVPKHHFPAPALSPPLLMTGGRSDGGGIPVHGWGTSRYRVPCLQYAIRG